MARAHGARRNFRLPSTAEQIWEEIRRVWLPGAGISYDRLDAPGGLQWPCPDDQHPGTRILHEQSFPDIGPAPRLLQASITDRALEQPDDDFPFVLVTGRNLYQFNAGTMTGRSATRALRPTDTLEMNAADADRLGLHEDESVRLRSRHGEAVVPVEITPMVPAGVVFATFHDATLAINRVTGPDRDPYTHTPNYKRTAVRIDPLVGDLDV